MKKSLVITSQLLIANAVIIICIGIASFLPAPWTGMGGRGFGPQVFYAAVFVMAASLLIRYKFHWPGLRMVLFLIPSQVLVLLAMSYFTGYTVSQLLFSEGRIYEFLLWLLFFDFSVAVPWILGVLIGGRMVKVKPASSPYDLPGKTTD